MPCSWSEKTVSRREGLHTSCCGESMASLSFSDDDDDWCGGDDELSVCDMPHGPPKWKPKRKRQAK